MSKRVHVHLLVAAAVGLGLVLLGLRPAGAAGNFTIGFAAVETTPTRTNGYTRALSGVSLGGYGTSCPLFGLGRRAPTGGCQDICVTFLHWHPFPKQHHALIPCSFPLRNRLGPLFGHMLQPHR